MYDYMNILLQIIEDIESDSKKLEEEEVSDLSR
jgi:hypothetical protein